VDLEGLYAPGMTRPQELSSGSAGYAHRQATGGLWGPEADRFAGAVLLAEMLGWCDPQVVRAAWEESYFAPQEMQQDTPRYRTLVEAVERHWGSNVARLFERAWRSDSLLDCPTFGEWLVALPLTPSPQPPSPLPLAGEGKGVAAQPPGEEVRAAAPAAVEAAAEIRALMQAARQLEEESNLPGALTVYRQAQALAVTETGLLAELNAIVQNIQERLRSTPPSTPHFPVVAGRQNEPIEVLFEKGMAAYQAGDWAQAGQWLEQVVQQQPHYRQGSQQAWILLELVRRQMEARKPELVADQLQLLKTYRTQPPGMGGWLRGPSPVEAVAFSPDGQLLAACTVAGEIWIWHLDQETPGYVLKEGGPAFSLVFSPRGDLLVAGSKDGRIIRWRMPERSWIDALQGHHGSVFSVAFSPDGALLASGAQDRVIRVWHIETGQTLRALEGHTDQVLSVAFSPDGRRLASASDDQTVKLWDVATGQEVRTLSGHTDWVNSVAFSPDGRLLASGSDDQTVKLWDVETGQEVRTLSGHTDSVLSVAFSPDGRLLASGSGDNTVKLWDVATGQEVRTLRGHTDSVLSVAFSPDGRRLASGSQDGTVRIWGVGP